MSYTIKHPFITDVPADPNKGPAQQMRDAKREGKRVPCVAHIPHAEDPKLRVLDTVIQCMTEYEARERIQLKFVHKMLETLNGENKSIIITKRIF